MTYMENDIMIQAVQNNVIVRLLFKSYRPTTGNVPHMDRHTNGHTCTLRVKTKSSPLGLEKTINVTCVTSHMDS